MASTVNCCWKIPKNSTPETNIGMKPTRRVFSDFVVSGEEYICHHSTTAAISAITVTTVERVVTGTIPVETSATETTVMTTAMPIHTGYCFFGSGFGISWPASAMVDLRIRMY